MTQSSELPVTSIDYFYFEQLLHVTYAVKLILANDNVA